MHRELGQGAQFEFPRPPASATSLAPPRSALVSSRDNPARIISARKAGGATAARGYRMHGEARVRRPGRDGGRVDLHDADVGYYR